MSAGVEARKHRRNDDSPILDRPVSSIEMLSFRLGQCHRAYRAGDVGGLRGELRRLAEEAMLLSRQRDLVPSRLDNRLRMAAEREPSGRGAS